MTSPDTETQDAAPRRRWPKRIGIGILALLGILVVLVALLQVPPVATAVVRRLLTLVPLNPGNRLQVGRVSGNFLTGLTLSDVRLLQRGRELAYIPRLTVSYRLPRLRPPAIRLEALEVDGARVTTRRRGGRWDLLDVMRSSSDTTGGGGSSFAIGRLTVRGARIAAELAPDSIARVRDFDLAAHDLVVGDTTLAVIDSLSLAARPPAGGNAAGERWIGLATRGAVTADELRFDPLRIHTDSSELTGRAVVPRSFDQARSVDRLDVRLAARPLDLADLRVLAPSVPAGGKLRFDAKASAEGNLATAHLAATLDRASVTLDGRTRIEHGSPTAYRVRGTVRRLDPSRLSTAAPAGEVNGGLEAETDGPLDRANGSIRFHLADSRIGTTIVRRLELGALLSRGTADLTLEGSLDSGTVSATGRARPFDSIPSYRLSGRAIGLPGSGALASGLTGAEGSAALQVGFRLAGSGTAPASARARGRMDLTAIPDTGRAVPLGHAAFTLAAGRLHLAPLLLVGGGRISAVGRVTLGDTLRYRLSQGTIDRVDLGKLSGDTVSAPLTGSFSLTGRGTAPAEARLTARLHFDSLRYGARRVDGVDAVARLDRGRLRLEADGALQGGRLALEALGWPFDSTASYVLRRATLERVDLGGLLDRPDLAGPVTIRASGEGRWREGDRRGRARIVVDSSTIGRIAISGGRADLTLDGDRLGYQASLRTSGGALALAGEGTPATETPAYRVRQGRVSGVELGALLGRPDLHTDLNATFTVEASGRSADSLRAGLGVVLLPSRVNQAELSSGSLRARVRAGRVEGTLAADGRDAGVAANLTGTMAGGAGDFQTDGTLRVENLARWTGRRDADGRDADGRDADGRDADGRIESRFALRMRTDSLGLRTAAGTVDAVGGVGGVRIQTLHLALSPLEGGLQVDTMQLRSNAGVLDGGGRMALRTGTPPGTLRLAGVLGDLGPVAALAGADTVAFDSARVDLAVTGPAWHWGITGGADAHGLTAAGNLVERVTVNLAATVDSTRLGAVSGRLAVKDAAIGTLSLRELTASGRYDSTLALDAALNIADSLRLATRLRGTVAGDTMRAMVERLDLDEGGRSWKLERPAGLVIGPQIEVHRLALRSAGRRIAVKGVFNPRDSSDVTLRITGLDLATLRSAGLAPIAGRVDGFARLAGRAAAPRLRGRVALTIPGRDGRQVGRVGTDLDWTAEGLRLAAEAKPVSGGGITVTGTLPYRLTLAPRDTATTVVGVERNEADTVALAIRADSFNLALFQPLLPPDAARGLEGLLRVNARVGGSIRAPEASGTVSLTRAELELPAIGIAYERGELAGRLTGDTLRIDRLRLYTGKEEELAASGAIRLRPLSEPGLALAARLEHFRLVNSDQLHTGASGTIRLSGTLLQPSLGGTLRLDRTEFFVGAAAAQAKVEQVDVPAEDLRKLARDFGPAVLSRGEETPGLMDRLRLDLAIRMPRQVWIRRNSSPRTDIELMGRLRVTQVPGGDMQFFGHVEPVPGRGTIELNGRQFRVTDGDIDLAGPVDSTQLDVNATYQVPTQGGGDDEGVLITVHARGRLDSLGLEFSSDPSMSEDDILSYIVTGKPSSDNPLFEGSGGGGGGGGGNAGTQVAMSTLSNALSNAAGKSLGFDTFQIRQEPTRGLTLTAGRYLGPRLFLDVQLPLGSASQQRTGTTLGPGFELEYTLRRWLRADLRAGSLSPGLLFLVRHEY